MNKEPDLDAIQAPAPVAFHKLNRAQLLTLAIALQDQRDNALAVVRSQQAQIERVEALADEIAEGAGHSLLNKVIARHIRAALTATE